VAFARHRQFDDIEPLAQGRVWLGSQARSRGLVDEIGGLDKAIEMVKQKARIPAGERVGLMIYPGRRNLLDLIMKKSQEDMLEARVSQVLGRMPFHAWMRGGYLRMMPYWFEVR
jgi:protease-4